MLWSRRAYSPCRVRIRLVFAMCVSRRVSYCSNVHRCSNMTGASQIWPSLNNADDARISIIGQCGRGNLVTGRLPRSWCEVGLRVRKTTAKPASCPGVWVEQAPTLAHTVRYGLKTTVRQQTTSTSGVITPCGKSQASAQRDQPVEKETSQQNDQSTLSLIDPFEGQ